MQIPIRPVRYVLLAVTAVTAQVPTVQPVTVLITSTMELATLAPEIK
jgi:hypothetical protein